MATLTINSDHTAYLSTRTITAASDTVVALTVNVDDTVKALGVGKYVYMDFIRADGKAFYKSRYDCTEGTFTVILGSVDKLIGYDGKIWIQFVLRDAEPTDTTYCWKSKVVEARVAKPAGAVPSVLTASATTGYPATYYAETVTVADPTSVLIQHQVEEELERIHKYFDSLVV